MLASSNGRLNRIAPLLVGVVILVVGTVASAVLLPALRGKPTLYGSSLQGMTAPSFDLINAQGQTVSLASLRGKAVALTFIYTNCPDICPLITEKFQQAYRDLGPDASKVTFVAITVDPETDTPQRIAQYSQAMGMAGKWEFLTGSRAALRPVWSAYHVAPLPEQQAIQLVQKGTSVLSSPSFQGAHSAVVYVIDPKGREQRLLDPDFTPGQLVDDLRALSGGT